MVALVTPCMASRRFSSQEHQPAASGGIPGPTKQRTPHTANCEKIKRIHACVTHKESDGVKERDCLLHSALTLWFGVVGKSQAMEGHWQIRLVITYLFMIQPGLNLKARQTIQLVVTVWGRQAMVARTMARNSRDRHGRGCRNAPLNPSRRGNEIQKHTKMAVKTKLTVRPLGRM